MFFSAFNSFLGFGKKSQRTYPSGRFTDRGTGTGTSSGQVLETDSRLNVTGFGAAASQAAAELVPKALIRALNRYIREEMEFYVACDPSHRFQLQEITTWLTAGNIALLQSIAALPDKMRNKIAEDCLKKSIGPDKFDLGKFYGWRISQDAAGKNPDSRIYKEVAGTSPNNMALDFTFVGEWIDVGGEIGKNAHAPSAHPIPDDQVPLARMVIEKSNGTVMAEHRFHHRREFPVVIGRNSFSDIRIDNRYVSRSHLRLDVDDRTGTLSVENLTHKDRLAIKQINCNTIETIPQGRPFPLTSGDRLVLSPAAGEEATTIVCEIFRPPSDHMETLVPLSASTQAIVSKTNTASQPSQTVTSETVVVLSGSKGEIPSVRRDTSGTIIPGQAWHQSGNNMETIVPSDASSAPLARIAVQYPDGKTFTVPVPSVPFEIGRDPDTEQYLVIEDAANHVSRQHLRIERCDSGCLHVENLAYNRVGTFRENGTPYGQRFMWTKDNGWIFLAGKKEQASVYLKVVEI